MPTLTTTCNGWWNVIGKPRNNWQKWNLVYFPWLQESNWRHVYSTVLSVINTSTKADKHPCCLMYLKNRNESFTCFSQSDDTMRLVDSTSSTKNTKHLHLTRNKNENLSHMHHEPCKHHVLFTQKCIKFLNFLRQTKVREVTSMQEDISRWQNVSKLSSHWVSVRHTDKAHLIIVDWSLQWQRSHRQYWWLLWHHCLLTNTGLNCSLARIYTL